MRRNDALTERYEELRTRALGRHTEGTIWGLVILRTKGITSWARAWQEYAEDYTPQTPCSVPSFLPLSSTGDDMVRVLAGMVWAVDKEG